MKAHIHRHLVETARGLSAELAEGIAAAGPLALPKPETRRLGVFLVRAVIGQQLSVKVARRIWGRVEVAAQAHGGDLLAFLTEEHAPILKTCGVSGPKIQALLALNAAEAQGDLCPARLRALVPEVRTAHLCRIRGIGPWTGDMAAIFYFQEPDIWPDRDAAAGKAFRRFLREDQILAEAAARFAPYRSFLALHLWRLVDGAL
ncbi:MAG: DNA-3-methyladenine glycosylase 2 family protein [Candidatus Competibacteraceae bacterium]|nr:DNA-3-methyladenine glycosylase 2 family protein [Candidatus Competibacteraceae bacterium]